MRFELPIIGAKSSYLNDHAGRSRKLAVFDFFTNSKIIGSNNFDQELFTGDYDKIQKLFKT